MKKLLPFLLLFLCSCAATVANPYKEYFTDLTEGGPEENIVRTEGAPMFRETDDINAEVKKMEEEGYEVVGYSNFEGPDIPPDQAKEQARAVGAAVVLIQKTAPRRVETGRDDITVASVEKSKAGGGKYEYLAFYMAKIKKFTLGVRIRELNRRERVDYKRKTGVAVKTVIKGSPADEAGLAEGDVIARVGDGEVKDIEAFQRLVRLNRGKEVRVVVLREGAEREVSVRLNE